MRIAISGASAIAALLVASAAAGQAAPPAPGKGAPPAAGKKAAPGDPNAPPPPPAPVAPGAAATTSPSPTPMVAPVFPSESSPSGLKDPPIAGWNDGFFLRDPGDYFRLYPRGRLHLDFHSFPGAPVPAAKDGGSAMQPRFFARRLRLEVSGQALQRWTFTFGVDFGGQTLSNANGTAPAVTAEPSENNPGTNARFAPIEAVSSTAFLANAFINYSLCPCLNIMLGQVQAPFSMENRTSNDVTTFMERNLPMRSFVAPNAKEIGLTLWGDLLDNRLSYELGVYAGDGQNRPQVDAYPDFIGRIFTRPMLGGKGTLEKLQVGVSGRVGQRDQDYVGYDYQPITTAQGFNLWEPRYTDSQGRSVHVLPSGLQTQVGGELRLPFSTFEIRGEGYYVSNDTREALEGTQLTNTERLGQMTGVGWYVQLSAWPWGDAFVNGDPGMWRPHVVNVAGEMGRPQKGLEVAALVGGVHADYQGASRGGPPASPSGTQAASKITVLEYGFAINYWFTRFVRASVNYVIYHTPDSGTPDNLAVVPGNLWPRPNASEHLLHELGTRVGIGF